MLPSGQVTKFCTVRAELRRGIKEAKEVYKKKIEHHISGNDSRWMWQDIRDITNFRGFATTAETNYSAQLSKPSLPSSLNDYRPVALTPVIIIIICHIYIALF